MTRRNVIAAILFVVLAFSVSTEYFRYTNQNYYWTTYAATMLTTIVLTILWLFADGKQRGTGSPSTLAYFMTILFIPIGVIIYFFQSRTPKQAIIATIIAILFVLMAMLLGDELGGQIYSRLPTPG